MCPTSVVTMNFVQLKAFKALIEVSSNRMPVVYRNLFILLSRLEILENNFFTVAKGKIENRN